MTITTEKLLTAGDLLQLDSKGVRGELIRGALCKTMPTGVRHGQVVVNLTILLGGIHQTPTAGVGFGLGYGLSART